MPAPNVKKDLEAQARVDAQEEQTREALAKVSPIERIVAIDADVIRAIKSKDGKIMYLVDNGRFASSARWLTFGTARSCPRLKTLPML